MTDNKELIAAAVATFLGGSGGGGGGEPAQYLKSIVKDDVNKTITITDKEGNTTTFEYGSGVSSLIVEVDELPTEDIIDGIYYKLPNGSLNKHLGNEWYVSQVYQYEWNDNSTTLELHDSKGV